MVNVRQECTIKKAAQILQINYSTAKHIVNKDLNEVGKLNNYIQRGQVLGGQHKRLIK
jgi:hypothetical protein